MTSASSAMVVGHTSGHWVKPKNTTTTLPRKSASVRSLPPAPSAGPQELRRLTAQADDAGLQVLVLPSMTLP